jgi:hypothetical protein
MVVIVPVVVLVGPGPAAIEAGAVVVVGAGV